MPPEPEDADLVDGAVMIRNLSVMHYANGVTLWSYKMLDAPLAKADDPAFWLLVIPDMVRDGDFVTISARDGGAVRYVRNGRLEALK